MNDMFEPAAVHEAPPEGETRRNRPGARLVTQSTLPPPRADPFQPAAKNSTEPVTEPPQPRGANRTPKPDKATPRGNPIHAATVEPAPDQAPRHDDGEAEVPPRGDTQPSPDLRFAAPVVQQIVELWRQRQDFVRAQTKLTLQIKATCRRFTGGDKAEADRLYRSLKAGGHPAAGPCLIAVAPLLSGREPLEAARAAHEKALASMARGLPIAFAVEGTRGLGWVGLAAIVGECGDLSAYRSVSAVWKRCGLAVIDGGRQRRVAGDAAFAHGYSPARHSVIWTIADSLLKAQGKGETAGPYRRIYDARKAIEAERTTSAAHAHARAMRVMAKALIKDLTLAWRNLP